MVYWRFRLPQPNAAEHRENKGNPFLVTTYVDSAELSNSRETLGAVEKTPVFDIAQHPSY